MAVSGEQVDGVGEVVAHGVGDEVVEVDPGPAGLDAFAADADLVPVGAGVCRVDGQQPVAVGARAGAAAAGLDAEQVVEQRDDVVVVQVAVADPDAEGHDGQPAGVWVAEDLDVRVGLPPAEGVLP